MDALESLNNVTVPALEIPDSTRVVSTTVLYGILVAVSLSVYSVLRKMFPRAMTPRLFRQEKKEKLNAFETPLGVPEGVRETRTSGGGRGGFLCVDIDMSWSWKSLALRESDLIRLCGVDGYILLRVVRFCWALLTGYCLAAAVVLFPAYYTSEISTECAQICEIKESEANGDSSDTVRPWDAEASCVCGWIDRASMATLKTAGDSLWTPVLALYILSYVTLYAAKLEYQKIIRIQSHCWEKLPQAYSVLIEHIPSYLRERSGTRVRDYFETIFPGQVVSVDIMDSGSKQFSSLVELGVERNYIIWRLERLNALLATYGDSDTLPSSSSSTTTSSSSSCSSLFSSFSCGPACCSKSPSRREMIAELQRQLDHLNAEYARQKASYLRDSTYFRKSSGLHIVPGPQPRKRHQEVLDPEVTSSSELEEKPQRQNGHTISAHDEEFEEEEDDDARSLLRDAQASQEDEFFSAAFVTFRSLVASSVASQSQIDDTSSMRVLPAPQPLDVSWEHIGMSNKARMMRRAITKPAFYLILLFWGVLTSFVGASTSTKALARQFPTLRIMIAQHPELTRFLDQFAPLVLVTLVSVVNPLMGILARFEGRVSESAADKRAMERYFAFLVIQVFLFYSVAGTVFKTFVEIIQQPSKIVDTLGATIPKNAAFYIQFIIVKLFWMLSFELLRISDIVLAGLRRIVAGAPVTARERVSMFCGCFAFLYPSPISLPLTLAQILLVYFIAIVYAVIQPLILPAAFAFFAFANVVYTTVLTTSAKVMYDSGGHFWWQSSYRCISLGLLTAQLTLIGVLLIKQGYRESIAVWLLFFSTIFFSYKIDTRYAKIASSLPVHLASKIDSKRRHLGVVQVQPPVWAYGAIRPGYRNLSRSDVVILYSYRHPVLDEPDTAEPYKYNLQSQKSQELCHVEQPATALYGAISSPPV